MEKGYERVMIMEDDAAFTMDFLSTYETSMAEINNVPEWDWLYLGRHKVFKDRFEPDVANTENWVHPTFNSLCLHYIVTASGEVASLSVC